MPACIRETNLSDAPALANVHVSSWRSAYHGLLPAELLDSLDAGNREPGWRHDLNSGATTILACEDETGVVGFVNFGTSHDDDAHERRVGEICGIYLLEEAWGKGYGKQMCDEALRHLRADGCETVILWVLRENKRAIEFYRRQGFAADGRTDVKRTRSGHVLNVARYSLQI